VNFWQILGGRITPARPPSTAPFHGRHRVTKHEECDSYDHYSKHLTGGGMFKIVVRSVEKFERDGHPLHMLRCGRVVGQSNKPF